MTVIPTVDAVITWVSGNDNAHAQKLAHYCSSMDIRKFDQDRYAECGEINYCVYSLLKFAPWLRSIFIVSDAQKPPVMDALKDSPYAKKIILVDHKDIFSDISGALPTFNSLAIETVLWRIQGLAEHFIYFNDDVFLVRPVRVEDFFRQNQLVLRGFWKKPFAKNWAYRLLRFKPPAHRLLQEKSAALAGFCDTFLHLPHAPFALQKSELEAFFTNYPELLLKNASHAFRDPSQFWSISLAEHLALKEKRAIIDNSLQSVYVEGNSHSLRKIQKRLEVAEKNAKVAFLCMQDMSSLSQRFPHLINQFHQRITQGFCPIPT